MYVHIIVYGYIHAYYIRACVYTLLSIIIQKLTEIYQIIHSYLVLQYDSYECNEKGILNPCSIIRIMILAVNYND